MTPDELRALADALPEGVHWSDPITPDMLAEAIRRFCADAEPVAWVQSNHLDEARRSVFMARLAPTQIYQDYVPLYARPAPAVPAGWKWVPVEPTPEMLSAVGMMDGYDWHAPGCSPDADHANWYSAMIAAAPAAPQAAPMADSDADYWLRNRQPILDAIERAGFMLMSNASGFWLHPRGKTDAQAEPKREPLLGELMREQRQSRIVAGAYPDGNPNAGAMMAQTRQAEPKPTPASGDDLSVYKEMADSYRNDEPTGAPYGIIDPDYGRVYTIARKLAWEEGYAIGLHGSFTRDLDLIAVPWTDTACEPEHLIRRIVDATGLKLRDGVAVKPHGRRAWTLKFPTFGDPRFVDLSVMPRIGGSDAE